MIRVYGKQAKVALGSSCGEVKWRRAAAVNK